MSSLWRVNLTKVHAMDEDPYLTVEWEPVKTVGGDIGKISHHSAVVCAPNKVIFYGGLVGEDSNDKVYLFDLVKHSWSQIPLKVSTIQLTTTSLTNNIGGYKIQKNFFSKSIQKCKFNGKNQFLNFPDTKKASVYSLNFNFI